MITDYDQGFPACSVEGKGKSIATEVNLTPTTAKERNEEQYDQKVEVSGKAPGVGVQHSEQARLPAPDRNELFEELYMRLKMTATSSKEDSDYVHVTDEFSDEETWVKISRMGKVLRWASSNALFQEVKVANRHAKSMKMQSRIKTWSKSQC